MYHQHLQLDPGSEGQNLLCTLCLGAILRMLLAERVMQCCVTLCSHQQILHSPPPL